MKWLERLFQRNRHYDDLDVSIREHIEERAEELMEDGMAQEEAARQARREFGNVTVVTERSRQVWQWPMLESIWADVKFALRQLRRSPEFTVVCLLTLALGVGANTAVYSIIQAVLLRSLPYHDPHRLMLLADPQDPQDGGILYKDFEAWKQQSRSFADMAVYYRNSGWSRVALTGSQEPEAVQGAFVSANFFSLLGMSPALGRTFTVEEEARHERVAVLSYGLWQRRFGGSPDILGQKIRIDGNASQIIGVMPGRFQFPARDSQFWAPITTNRYWKDPALNSEDGLHSRGFYARWQAIARLKPDVSSQQAQAELDTIFKSLERVDPDPNRSSGVKVLPLHVQVSGNTRLALYVLFGSVSLLLLIACANVANLVLARGLSRTSEIALRTALGASRGRIFRQLLTETVVLAVLASFFSLPVAFFGIRELVAMGPPNIPRLQETGLDLGALGFTLAVALLCAVIFGMVPALKVWRSDPVNQMKSSSAGMSNPTGLTNTRSILIVAEFALSVLLLTGAGLLIHSLLIVRDVDPGFEPQHVLKVNISLPGGSSGWPSSFFDLVVAKLQAVPGVTDVGAIDNFFDLGPTGNLGLRSVEGHAPEQREQWTALTWDTVRGDYFQTIGAQLLRGRYFSEDDGPHSPLVAVIDERAARRYWPGENPVGKRFRGQDHRGQNDDWLTVIGVVGDIRTHGLERLPTPHIYEWYQQAGNATPDIVVRTAGDPAAVAASLRSAIRSVAPTAILSDVTTVEQQLLHQLAPRRFQASLLGLFSSLALLLASIGIYGLIHYSVVQRTHEIGIRMALGAQRGDILRIVICQGLFLAGLGLMIGLTADWASTRVLSKLLYGVTPFDPVTLATVSLLLIGVALFASLIPALRASRVDPVHALRSE
jgi:predicted permease